VPSHLMRDAPRPPPDAAPRRSPSATSDRRASDARVPGEAAEGGARAAGQLGGAGDGHG
jgi:hypothetical protein